MQEKTTDNMMTASAEFEMPVLDIIRNRRSRRAYSSRPVEAEKIQAMFEAARWAPSSVNEQPWKYIYATRDQALWGRIVDTLNESNKVWVKNAPLLVVSLARKRFLRNDRPNPSARYDVGAANAFLSLQATALGLNVRQIGGFDPSKAIANLNIPDTYEPVTILAIGYPGEVDLLPDHLKVRELSDRVRYVRDAFVMNSPFGD